MKPRKRIRLAQSSKGRFRFGKFGYVHSGQIFKNDLANNRAWRARR